MFWLIQIKNLYQTNAENGYGEWAKKTLENQNKDCWKSRWSVLWSALFSEHLVRAENKAISLHIQAQQLWL